MADLVNKLAEAALEAAEVVGSTLGDMALDAVPDLVVKLVPAHWIKIAKARGGDLVGLGKIAANEDLIRALRQSWVHAALLVHEVVAVQSRSPDSAGQAEAFDRFATLLKQQLRRIRDASYDRGVAPGHVALDTHLLDVLVGVPQYVMSKDLAQAQTLTREFVPTLAASVGWPAQEVPLAGVYARVAESGSLADARSFGELALAAFAEIVKHPDDHPEASKAFDAAQYGLARTLALDTLGAVHGVSAQIAELSALVREVVQNNTPQPAPAFEWPQAQSFDAYIELKAQGFHGRERLQQRVHAWLAAAAPQVMLIMAPFGVGKSALMATLCRTLRAQGTPTVVHFCRFDEQDTLQPGKIVRSFAAQLAAAVEPYREALQASAEAQQALTAADNDARVAWSRGVVDLLMRLPDQQAFAQHVVLIDGLDESLELHNARQGGEGSLLDLVLLGTAGRLPPWLRVVISSRDVPQLGARIAGFECIRMLDDDPGANRQDIEQFVREHTRDARMQQLLHATADGEVAALDRLVTLCDGKFLLARYVLEEARAPSFDATALERLLQRGREVSGMDAFYEHAFKRRVLHAGSDPALMRTRLDPALIRAVLGQVAVALDPLADQAIAAVLADAGIGIDAVRAVVDALGGLLESDDAGITFDHFSIEQWLDPSRDEGRRNGRPKAGVYAIDRPASVAALQAHCRRLADTPDPLAAAGPFAGYLALHGVVHLLDSGALPSALSLLVALAPKAQRASTASKAQLGASLYRLESATLEAIEARLEAIDEGDDRDGAAQQALRAMAAPHLARLLQTRAYETGRFRPVIRTLVQFHPDAWPEIHLQLLEHSAADLVFRDDIGVAYAQAWHSSADAPRTQLLADIEAMAADAADESRREIAGYAFKHICQRVHGGAWWSSIAGVIQAQATTLACSAEAVDRMVAGEMLLSLALQGEPVVRWLAEPEARAAFWDPYWPNLRCDIAAIHAACGSAAPPEDDAEMAAALASCALHDTLAQTLTDRLLDDALFKSAAAPHSLVRLVDAVASMAVQQCDKAALDDTLGALEALVDRDETRELVFDLVRRLMLHPLWDVTESASSLVSDLIERQDRKERWWLIDRLLDCDPAQWRLRYGAVDAAYNAGAVDGYKKFKQALLAVGRDAHCRVRGICADDLRAWMLYADTPTRRAVLTDPAVVSLLQCWLTQADDCWLLEYLHLLLHELHQRPGDRGLIKALLPAQRSRFLAAAEDGREFYLQDGKEFLARIEDQRRQEWRAFRSCE